MNTKTTQSPAEIPTSNGLAGGDVASRCRAEFAEHQTVYADDRRRKALFAEAADLITELGGTLAELLSAFPALEEYESWDGQSLAPLAVRVRAAIAKVELVNNPLVRAAAAPDEERVTRQT